VYLLVYHAYFLLGILIIKGLTARRLYQSFGVKGLNHSYFEVWLSAPPAYVCTVAFNLVLTGNPAFCTGLDNIVLSRKFYYKLLYKNWPYPNSRHQYIASGPE
jgi:hypothetical protein